MVLKEWWKSHTFFVLDWIVRLLLHRLVLAVKIFSCLLSHVDFMFAPSLRVFERFA